jgi:hypothetical protein
MTPPRPYSLPVGFACVVLGAGMFAWLVVNTQIGAPPPGRMVGTDPRLAFLLTPVFLLPILIYATLTGRFGLWWAFGLLVGITVFHGIALQAAGLTYRAYTPNPVERLVLDNPDWQRYRAEHAAELLARARRTAITGGLIGGALGAGASMLLLAPALKLQNLAFPLVATFALAGIGALGLSDLALGPLAGHLPEAKPSLEYALRLFLPWQLAFGAAMVWMMRAAPSQDEPSSASSSRR